MWLKTYDTSQACEGRVNSTYIAQVAPAELGDAYVVQALMTDGTTRILSAHTYETHADAAADVDNILSPT